MEFAEFLSARANCCARHDGLRAGIFLSIQDAIWQLGGLKGYPATWNS